MRRWLDSPCAAWATDMELGCASGVPSAGRAPGRTIARFFERTIPARRLVPLINRRPVRVARWLIAGSMIVMCATTALGQESLIERLQLDKLQIVSLGVSAGRI